MIFIFLDPSLSSATQINPSHIDFPHPSESSTCVFWDSGMLQLETQLGVAPGSLSIHGRHLLGKSDNRYLCRTLIFPASGGSELHF